jgi:hypothetical protein
MVMAVYGPRFISKNPPESESVPRLRRRKLIDLRPGSSAGIIRLSRMLDIAVSRLAHQRDSEGCEAC